MGTMVLALNTISGQVADVSPKMLEHPKFKDVLVAVEAGTKPYIAELYTPGTKEEKSARKAKNDTIKVDFGNEPVVEEKVIETSTDTEEEI
jgi:hypothetical protein|tara:strand:+ start:2458 stop:2730 length:273 start_codon:yes stop_codon:yes gene_type:complete